MTTFKRFLKEQASFNKKEHRVSKSEGCGTLYVFDIDETLFKTTAMVRVLRGNSVPLRLSNREYNDYELKPGERFDFSEFIDSKKFSTESIPIRSMIRTLVRIHDKIKLNLYSGGKIILNTARGDLDNDEVFHGTFKDHGIDIDNIDVNMAGNLLYKKVPAERKQVVVRKYLKKKKYDSVYMYDDSKTNLTYFLQLKHEFPDVDFRAYYIDEDGNICDFHPER